MSDHATSSAGDAPDLVDLHPHETFKQAVRRLETRIVQRVIAREKTPSKCARRMGFSREGFYKLRERLGLIFWSGEVPVAGRYETQFEALLAAVQAVRAEGGGRVWLHKPDCMETEHRDDCPCGPVPLEVPANG